MSFRHPNLTAFFQRLLNLCHFAFREIGHTHDLPPRYTRVLFDRMEYLFEHANQNSSADVANDFDGVVTPMLYILAGVQNVIYSHLNVVALWLLT